MKFVRGTTAALEIAHRGLDGRLHGHSLMVEAWTEQDVDLDAWRAALEALLAGIEGQIEETIGGRQFEDVAAAVMTGLPGTVRVVVALPTRGHRVELSR